MNNSGYNDMDRFMTIHRHMTLVHEVDIKAIKKEKAQSSFH